MGQRSDHLGEGAPDQVSVAEAPVETRAPRKNYTFRSQSQAMTLATCDGFHTHPAHLAPMTLILYCLPRHI